MSWEKSFGGTVGSLETSILGFVVKVMVMVMVWCCLYAVRCILEMDDYDLLKGENYVNW